MSELTNWLWWCKVCEQWRSADDAQCTRGHLRPDFPIFDGTARDGRLRDLVIAFMKEQDITCEETIHQTDRVSEASLPFIESLCNVVGYPGNTELLSLSEANASATDGAQAPVCVVATAEEVQAVRLAIACFGEAHTHFQQLKSLLQKLEQGPAKERE